MTPNPRRIRTGRATFIVAAFGMLGVLGFAFALANGKRTSSDEAGHRRTVPSEAALVAQSTAPAALVVTTLPPPRSRSPLVRADQDSGTDDLRTPPPSVPGAYTGDAEGQALWEKTVEEDQATLQPDDLVVEPPIVPADLSKLPAYQADHLDADGNVN